MHRLLAGPGADGRARASRVRQRGVAQGAARELLPIRRPHSVEHILDGGVGRPGRDPDVISPGPRPAAALRRTPYPPERDRHQLETWSGRTDSRHGGRAPASAAAEWPDSARRPRAEATAE